MARTNRDLTRGSIPRNLITLALPLIAANLLQTTFNIVDMLFVGRLGPEAIAAISLAGVIMMFLMTIAIGLATGTQAMISRLVGAQRPEEAEAVAIQSLLLGLFSSFFLSLTGLFLSHFLLELVGAKGEVLSLGNGYLQVMFSGIYTMFLLFLTSAIFQGVGNTVTPMKILFFSTLLNIALDPLLIFGLWFFPRWGVNGAGVATVTARGLGMIVGISLLFKGKSGIYLHLREIRVDLGMMWRIIRIGLFASLQAILRNISQLVVVRIVAFYGTFAIAAYGIGMRVRMVV
ncbi:MAG: MATE family efflux transporter, partial [Proteobacteria bacterium]|nr:MATE family efflux transporter [Pseudomonadota bacterium]